MKKMLEFVFSPNGFLLVPLVIILFIVLSNIEPIMDKMGFETRANLKAELTKAKYTITLLKADIHGLKEQQVKFENHCSIKEELVNEHIKETEVLDSYIKDVINSNSVNSTIPNKDLIKTEPILSDEVDEIDIEPLNNNIVSINKVYNELFGG